MHELAQAMERKDAAAVAAHLAPDAVLRSPISRRIVFRGRDEIQALLEIVYATIGPATVDHVVGEGRTRVFITATTVRGLPLEDTMVMTFDDEDRVTELRLFIRAMPQLVTFAATLGPPLARRRSRLRALALRVLFEPLAFFVRVGEPVGVALSGAGTRVGSSD